MFEELIPRLSLRATGPVTRMRSNLINGIKTFPVTVEAPRILERGRQ